ncbi:MAG: HNH endonuclease [Polyangiaceae bacterium]|nr:HNH endonuclease [Polyangiaceae bacterium]
MSTRTLLLTAWYFPVRVLQWQDAVKMIYEGTVDVLAEYDEVLRSPSTTWMMPAVVRLRRSVGRHRRGLKFSRMNVFLRDRFRCQYCGQQFRWGELTFDHLVPRSRGGRTEFRNIVTACRPCNTRKANRTCDEAGMFPLMLPRQPDSLPLGLPVLLGAIPSEWAPFVPSSEMN